MIYKTVGSNGRNVSLIDYPLECPSCHHRTTPNFIYHKTCIDSSKIYAFLSCPNPKCDTSYTALYENSSAASYYFKSIVKGSPRQEIFPNEIELLSPSFIKIYNEAFTAEQLSLLEISGV